MFKYTSLSKNIVIKSIYFSAYVSFHIYHLIKFNPEWLKKVPSANFFMASIDSWRDPLSGYLSLRNRKKSQGSKSGEYGGWAMTFFRVYPKIQLQLSWNVTAHYRGEKFMSCLPKNPAVYDEFLHVDASKWPSSIPYWPFDLLEWIHGEPYHGSVLRLQTGVPTHTIARRIRVKRVGRDDGARGMRRSSSSRSRVRERQGKNKSSAPCHLSLLASYGYGVQSCL